MTIKKKFSDEYVAIQVALAILVIIEAIQELERSKIVLKE